MSCRRRSAGWSAGPSPIVLRADGVFDLSDHFPTVAGLLDLDDPLRSLRAAPGRRIGTLDALLANTARRQRDPALPHLLANPAGRIVNIGAGAAFKAGAGMGAYAAAKAGVARLTEALAAELLDRGVTVNAILPSIIDTPPNRADMPDADFTRWVRPEQIAATIGFLLSADAQAITGASIPVTGRVA